MKKDILAFLGIFLLVSLSLVSALSQINPKQSKSLNSGNNICEYYQNEFSIGEKDSITLNGETLNIEYLGNKNWKVNDYEGKLQNHDFFVYNQNSNLKSTRFDFNFMDQYQPEGNLGLTEQEYYPWDCQGYSQSTGMISEIKIAEGWNLVPQDISLRECYYALKGELCKDDVLVSYTYIPTLNKYFSEEELENQWKTNPSLKEYFSEENEFTFQKSSKWIYVKTDAVDKKVIGRFGYYIPYRNQYLNSGEFKLNKGWNFIFVDAFMIYDDNWKENSLSLEDMKGNCDFQGAYLWQVQNQKWKSISDFLEDKNILKNEGGVGAGFIVKVANDCTLGYNTDGTTTPPILPN